MMYYNTSADPASGIVTSVIEGVKVVFTQPVDGSVFVVANSEGYWCADMGSAGRHWQPYATADFCLYELDISSSKDGRIRLTDETAYEFEKLLQHGFTEVTAIPFGEFLTHRPKRITMEEWLDSYDIIGDSALTYMETFYGKGRHTMYEWERLMNEACAQHPQWALDN